MRLSGPLTGFPRLAFAGLAVLGGLWLALAAVLTPLSDWQRPWALLGGLAAGFCAGLLLSRLPRLRSGRIALAVVLGAALLTGTLWLAATRVSPVMDFDRMFQTAAALAESRPVPDAAYTAVFPHVLGYPFVLSLVFRLFGVSIAVAQGFNLLLSLCIAGLLFVIGRRLLGVSGGLAAGLAWALPPSHFMLLSLVASEPLHIALTLVSVWLFLCAAERPQLWMWAALGFAVALSGFIRPLGPVYLLAFALCYWVFTPKGFWLRKMIPLLLMAAVYLAASRAGAYLCERALDRPPASGGFGWNLYVGMNRVNAGGWNAADQELMSQRLREGLPASEIQALFQQEGLTRLTQRLQDGSMPRFMAKKFTQLWCQDSFTVYWLNAGAAEGSNIQTHASKLSAACDLAYGVLLGLCVLSLWRQFQTRNGAFLLPVTLLMGVTLLFLLLEANPRYHYAGSAALCLLAAGCIIPRPKRAETE